MGIHDFLWILGRSGEELDEISTLRCGNNGQNERGDTLLDATAMRRWTCDQGLSSWAMGEPGVSQRILDMDLTAFFSSTFDISSV